MKNVLAAVLLGALMVLAGCSKKESNNPLAPSPIETQAAVKFTMHLESGTQGMIFVASPNMDVRLQKVVVKYPPQQFENTLENPDPTIVIAKGSNLQIGEYTGVEAKQVWELTFVGNDAATNKPFTVKFNWEVV